MASLVFCGLSISLRIIADDSIHILKRYGGFRKSGLPPQQAVNCAFHQVGFALMLNRLILSLGLEVLIDVVDFWP